MNVEQIGEPIRVLAAFSGGSVEPLRFEWSSRAYQVSAINGRWTDRGGDGYRLHFSVQAGEETYFIHFSSVQVQWWLDQVVVT